MSGIHAEADVNVALSTDDFKTGINRLYQGIRGGDRSLRKVSYDTGLFPAAAPLILNLGGPPTGTIWYPMWVTVTGTDDHTVVANAQAAIYLGSQSPTPGQVPIVTNLLIPASAATALPYAIQLSGKEDVAIHYGENVLVVIWGGVAANTPITAICRYREVHPAAAEELSIL